MAGRGTMLRALAAAALAWTAAAGAVTYGSTLKLEHARTGYRLHSHDLPYGTGSGQQSVTALGDAGDVNSYWVVKGPHGAARARTGGAVRCGDTLRLQHVNTRGNLHSHLHHAPMSKDWEVSAFRAGEGRFADGDGGDDWVVECDGVWERFEKVMFRHVDTGGFLSASKGLVYPNPIPGQLQVAAVKARGRDVYWKTNEGMFIAPEGDVGA